MPLTTISQFIGSAYIINGSAWSTSTSVLAPFTPGPSVSPVVEFNPGPGIIQTTASTQPKFTVNNLAAGTYRVMISAVLGTSGANSTLVIWDGTTYSGYVGNDVTNNRTTILIGYFTYSNTGNRTFEVYVQNSSGSNTNLYALGGPEPGWQLKLSLEKVA